MTQTMNSPPPVGMYLFSTTTWVPASDTNPIPVAGFALNGNIATPLAVTNSSGHVALPSGAIVAVSNIGTVTALVKMGDGTVTATTADFPIFPSTSKGLVVGANTYLAAITSSGTTTLNLSGGTGLLT